MADSALRTKLRNINVLPIFKTNHTPVTRISSRSLPRCLISLLCCLIGAGSVQADNASESAATSAMSLRAKYGELDKKLSNNSFKRPLYLDSAETTTHLKGDIFALVNYPISTVNAALNDATHWCDVLILHLNTKYCHAAPSQSSSVLSVSIGKKFYEPLEHAHPVEFLYRAASTTSEYFNITLAAKKGPMGTSDYRILLEAVSIPGGKTFLHLTYSYAYGFLGQLAMQGYLATVGSGKVGFTSSGTQPNGQPNYIGGVRGVVERNTMRYYLAIDAYLGALVAPPQEQFEKRIQDWFSYTEQYSRQLHEVDRASYLGMKRNEYLRMQSAP